MFLSVVFVQPQPFNRGQKYMMKKFKLAKKFKKILDYENSVAFNDSFYHHITSFNLKENSLSTKRPRPVNFFKLPKIKAVYLYPEINDTLTDISNNPSL